MAQTYIINMTITGNLPVMPWALFALLSISLIQAW